MKIGMLLGLILVSAVMLWLFEGDAAIIINLIYFAQTLPDHIAYLGYITVGRL